MILLRSGGKIDDKPARLDINIENVSLASELESTVTAFFYLKKQMFVLLDLEIQTTQN